MKRDRIVASLLFLSLLLPVGLLLADVKTEEKSLVKFEGFLGRMMGLFGGKAAKEGIVNTLAIRGNRKATMSDTSGEIIDLDEEKLYSLDLKKKTYEVTTFAELRRKLLEARDKAAKAAKQEPEARPQGQEAEMEMDFSMKESGQKKAINGYDCREVIMTITMRQKGKTLEQGGGTVLTSNIWLGPEIPALKEIRQFDLRYAQKLDLPYSFGADSAEQMAAVRPITWYLDPFGRVRHVIHVVLAGHREGLKNEIAELPIDIDAHHILDLFPRLGVNNQEGL